MELQAQQPTGYTTVSMPAHKGIALVAHDHMKSQLVEWCRKHAAVLAKHELYATGTTGAVLMRELGLNVHRLQSGPLGGDMQVGNLIVERKIHVLIFFWDPLESQSHDPDVKALLRLASVWNTPCATNPSTADWLFASPFIDGDYELKRPVYARDVYRS